MSTTVPFMDGTIWLALHDRSRKKMSAREITAEKPPKKTIPAVRRKAPESAGICLYPTNPIVHTATMGTAAISIFRTVLALEVGYKKARIPSVPIKANKQNSICTSRPIQPLVIGVTFVMRIVWLITSNRRTNSTANSDVDTNPSSKLSVYSTTNNVLPRR